MTTAKDIAAKINAGDPSVGTFEGVTARATDDHTIQLEQLPPPEPEKPRVLVVGPKHGRTALLALLAANLDARLLDPLESIGDPRLPELPPMPDLSDIVIPSMNAFAPAPRRSLRHLPPPPTKKADKARAKAKAARKARRKSR